MQRIDRAHLRVRPAVCHRHRGSDDGTDDTLPDGVSDDSGADDGADDGTDAISDAISDDSGANDGPHNGTDAISNGGADVYSSAGSHASPDAQPYLQLVGLWECRICVCVAGHRGRHATGYLTSILFFIFKMKKSQVSRFKKDCGSVVILERCTHYQQITLFLNDELVEDCTYADKVLSFLYDLGYEMKFCTQCSPVDFDTKTIWTFVWK